MRCAHHLFCVGLLLWTVGAHSQDRFSVGGDVDLRWVHATGESSYLDGGLGILRFDPQHEDAQFGRAFLVATLRLTDIVSVHTALDAYGDYGGNPADVSEFYLDIHPFPTTAIRWRVRVGAFFMPVSLENRGIGWTDVYSITPSAINTWIGEEFRTIGAELESRWLGASSGYLGDVALIAAVYGWNDPAGLLIADRGFALSDRPSTLFDGLGKPPAGFYHEIDRKPGYYGGLSWKHHDRLEVRALRYDNRGDPGAVDAEGSAWRTRFSSVGARLEPSSHWTFAAQYLDGDTAVGADSLGISQFYMRFRADYALASFEWARERLTARYDDFHTHQLTGFFGPPSNQTGHGWTFAWSHELGEHWQLLAEWLHVESIFPPRAEIGIPAAQVQSQLQFAARYKFQFGW
jgi:Phosphate-selective porin O and P